MRSLTSNHVVDPDLSPRLQSVLRRLVDPKLGIIKCLTELPLQPDEHELYIGTAECADPVYFRNLGQAAPGPSHSPVVASGADLEREGALWSILGEACERYIAKLYQADELTVASAAELGDEALPIDRMIVYGDEQYGRPGFPFHRVDKSVPMRWARGQELTTGRPAYVPAQLVWLSYQAMSPRENFHIQVSSGLAAGPSVESAILTGLREVIERDAFACHWLLAAAAPRLRLDVDTIEPVGLRRLLQRTKCDVNLRWLETEFGVPCVLSIVTDPRQPGVALGMSCHPDPARAVQKAVVESFHTWNWVLEMRRRRMDALPAEALASFEDHVRHYLDPAARANLAHWEGDERLLLPAGIPEAGTAELLAILKARGFEAYGVDLTTPDLVELGIHVVKVIVPGLQPLHAGFGREHLDPRRLAAFAAWKGLALPERWDTRPHPFP